MALETATYIDDLVTTNPAAGDVVSQGDDHLRLIKQVLQTTFPNLSEAVAMESGNWTPTFSFATPGNLSVVYTTQSGTYMRVGPVVFVRFSLLFTPTHTTASGAALIGGLPFTVVASGPGGAIVPIIFSGTTMDADFVSIGLAPSTGTSNMLPVAVSSTPGDPHQIYAEDNLPSGQAFDFRGAGLYWT